MAYLLQQLLTESAARFPHQEAIHFQTQALSYAELDSVTNQVARALQRIGVRRGDRVGIFLHKSPASVISIFGVLKAGAVYVPLDPAAPATRLAYITRNCDIQVVLTSIEKLATLNQFFEEGTPLETAVVMNDGGNEQGPLPEALYILRWAEVVAEDEKPLGNSSVIETDLAYILYTSGSTGEPKGVMISHRTIFTFINWCKDAFQISEHDRVTSHAPIHFDLSTFDIYVTIQAGATVVLVPEKLSIFPSQLVKLLEEERITVTYMVPSILSLMVNYGKLGSHDLSELRLILFAGEVFPIRYLRQLVEAVPHADYYNLYGPTETNVCTYYWVQPHDVAPERTEPVPIGLACENMEVFAVDSNGQVISEPGREGELWARGSCVAQGYWGDEEKTAERFIRNPFQPHYTDFAYRTGDIVMLDSDGVNWRYVGRRDHMVKSRGYRVELGEIETAIYAHSAVKEAVVVAIPDEIVGSRLKAFVVPAEGNGVTVQDIEAHCRHQLPRYMVPESIEFLAALPKTSTGKVDRTFLAQT
jgi:amino acid adenylation domain-containing protein